MGQVIGSGLLVMLFLFSPAWGKIGGGDVVFRVQDAGNVVFSHDAHAGKTGMNCVECHRLSANGKSGNKRIMNEIKVGRYCGVCHNAQTAFGVTKNCERCHKK